jgi:hypothetical protein
MRLALAQILFVIPARGRILKRNQQLRMVDVSDSAAAQVQALMVNDVSDSEFNFSVHFGLVLGLSCLLYSVFFTARCAQLHLSVQVQPAARALATAACPLASTVTVSSEQHWSQSQKYSAVRPLRPGSEEQRGKSTRNNFPPRRY